MKQKFKPGDRVIYVDGANHRYERVERGTRGTVVFEYYGGGGDLKIEWDNGQSTNPVHPEELDWAPVVETLARLA